MAEVKLSPTLPKPDTQRNGLERIAKELIEAPDRQHIVVAVVDSNSLTIDHTTHGRLPSVRVLQIEPILSTADAQVAYAMLDKAYTKRTNHQPVLWEDSFLVDSYQERQPL